MCIRDRKRTIPLILFISLVTISFSQTYPGTMVDVSGGTFIMGNNNQPPMSNDQDPEHSVTVDDFKMGDTEVSNSYYVVFLNEMASLGNLMVEEGVPGDWSRTPEEIAVSIISEILSFRLGGDQKSMMLDEKYIDKIRNKISKTSNITN